MFILADDLGYGDTSGHGNPHVKTPQLDRFARDGIEFTHFYVSPFCHPSRASLLTGRYAQRTFREVSYRMDPAEVTVAEELRDAGYRTGMFGKWHLGDGPDKCPNAQGFDEVVTFVEGQLPAESYFDPELLHNGKPQRYRGYCMDVFTDEAIAFIKQNRDRPFFVYLPANLVHTPLIAPPALKAPYANLKGNLPTVYGMIESTDDNFGRLRATLRELGLEDNTLLIFASDNGPQILTVDGVERSAGLQGAKGTLYEGGIRTTCLMRWPAGFAGGRQVARNAAHIDILPTILDACGAGSPADVKVDGRSLLPLLRDPGAAWPKRTLYIQCDSNGPPTRGMAVAVLTERWKLVQPCGSEPFRELGMHPQYARLSAVQGRGERSISGRTPRFELYDIRNDPGEWRDVASQHPEIVTRLRADYDAWFDEIYASGRWNHDVQPGGASASDGNNAPGAPAT